MDCIAGLAGLKFGASAASVGVSTSWIYMLRCQCVGKAAKISAEASVVARLGVAQGLAVTGGYTVPLPPARSPPPEWSRRRLYGTQAYRPTIQF